MTTKPPPRPPRNAFERLRRFAKPRAQLSRCELCSAELPDEHGHLVEIESRRLCCVCEPCAILFSNPAAPKYRRVPYHIEYLEQFAMSDLEWEGLQLPINLAFFMFSTAAGRVVALYPSPAGATESLPSPDAWQAIMEQNPSLRNLQPDVEILLVNRLGENNECFRTGVDIGYSLVGVVRKHWRGLSGGTEVWQEIERFFVNLKQRAQRAGLP